MLEMVHYILKFIITMKHVIYGALLSATRGLGSAESSPSGVWGGAPAENKFDAFYPENVTSGGTIFHFPTFP